MLGPRQALWLSRWSMEVGKLGEGTRRKRRYKEQEEKEINKENGLESKINGGKRGKKRKFIQKIIYQRNELLDSIY